MSLKLYKVNADAFDDGEPHANDLFVWAETPREAVEYWREYYGAVGDRIDDPISVDEIPLNRAAGAIPWVEVPEVWRAKII